MAVGGVRFLWFGWVEKLYIEPKLFFKFYGFEWVHYVGDAWIYFVFYLMIASALGIALGLLYRWSSIVFFITFSYVELLDATNYLNHYYLVAILALFFIIVPAHRFFSMDQYVFGRTQLEVPKWCIDIFKLQLIIVYTYAGLAKLGSDWILQGLPLRIWLPEHHAMPLLGALFQQEWVAYVFSWLGAAYDISIGYFMLSRRLRPYAYIVIVVFHTMTHLLFNIGLFPFIMTLMTLVFFSPHFHKRFYQCVSIPDPSPKTSFHPTSYILVALLGIHFVVQLLLPLRHHLYAGSTNWHEQGYRFAWRVMLVEKIGQATFYVQDGPNGDRIEITNSDHLTAFQEKQMAIQPDFILQYAQYLDQYCHELYGWQDPVVTADVFVALNGRPSERFIYSYLDLSQIKDTFASKYWIR